MGVCERWLEKELNGGMVLCDVIRMHAKDEGFSKKQLKEARINLGVKTYNDYMKINPSGTNWYWALPQTEV